MCDMEKLLTLKKEEVLTVSHSYNLLFIYADFAFNIKCEKLTCVMHLFYMPKNIKCASHFSIFMCSILWQVYQSTSKTGKVTFIFPLRFNFMLIREYLLENIYQQI